MVLKNILKLTGQIELLMGLHIGCGNDTIEIGGIDNPVIKDLKTGLPIIPGSSIKGKIRSLLELKNGKHNNGTPCNCGDCDVCKCFGAGAGAKVNNRSITRFIFRDCFLSEESKKKLDELKIMATEAKTENTINRLTGTAEHPRITERVIAGLVFDFEVSIRDFDDNYDYQGVLKEGLKMLQEDCLGGSGSRGYGKIKFKNLKLDNKDFVL